MLTDRLLVLNRYKRAKYAGGDYCREVVPCRVPASAILYFSEVDGLQFDDPDHPGCFVDGSATDLVVGLYTEPVTLHVRETLAEVDAQWRGDLLAIAKAIGPCRCGSASGPVIDGVAVCDVCGGVAYEDRPGADLVVDAGETTMGGAPPPRRDYVPPKYVTGGWVPDDQYVGGWKRGAGEFLSQLPGGTWRHVLSTGQLVDLDTTDLAEAMTRADWTVDDWAANDV